MVPRGFLFFFPRSPAAAGALFFGAIKMKAGRTEGGRAEEREKGKSARGRIRDKAKAKMQEENDSLNPKRGHGGPIYRPRGGGGRRQYPADSAVGPPRRPAARIQPLGRPRQTSICLHVPPSRPTTGNCASPPGPSQIIAAPPSLARPATSSSLKGPGASKLSSSMMPGKGCCWGK